jgi:Tol biopolymer transport system component
MFCCVLLLMVAVFQIARGRAAVELITRLHSSATLSESADGPSGLPQISADGRYVLFTSGANNLVDSTYGSLAISLYVRDRVAGTTIRASSTNGGWPARGDAFEGAISADGRFVVFSSSATNLGANLSIPFTEIYRKDLQSGDVTVVSAPKGATGGVRGTSHAPSMTPGGRFVLFQSSSTELVPNGADGNTFEDVYVRDIVAKTNALISRRAGGTALAANNTSTPIAISTNGNFVLFYSLATDLSSFPYNTVTQRVWLRDLTLQTNIIVSSSNALVTPYTGPKYAAFAASMSPDASVVAFASDARLGDAAAPTNQTTVFAKFLPSGDLRAMALPTDVKTNLSTAATLVSPDGKRVALTMHSKVSGTNQPRLFVWDLPSDHAAEVDLSTLGPPEGGSVQPYFVSGDFMLLGSVTKSDTNTIMLGGPLTIRSVASTLLDASADGSVIAFATSEALAPGDLNNESDVYVISPAGLELISAADAHWKRPLPDMSVHYAQTTESRTDKIAFTSFSPSLVANDTNGFADIFTWSKSSGEVKLESVALDGGGANAHSSEPALSRDGKWLAFVSAASNLVTNDTNHMEDIFLKSMADRTIIRVSESARTPTGISLLGVKTPVISGGGRFVAYATMRNDITTTNITARPGVVAYDRTTGENIWVGNGLGTLTTERPIAIYGPNLYFFAGVGATNVYVINLETRERTLIGAATLDPAFTSDGSLVAMGIVSSLRSLIYTFDPASGLTNLVRSFPTATQLKRDLLSISDDKWIAFAGESKRQSTYKEATNDLYAISALDPSPVRVVTTPSPLPLGSGNLMPVSPMITRDGGRVFYLATTNSPVDLIPRTDVIVADVISGAVGSVTSNGDPDRAPYGSTKPVFVNGGVVTLTAARNLMDSPVDKANLIFYADVPDSDADGLPDLWENAVFHHLEETASGDNDADGMTNAQEMLAGTNPLSESSILRLIVKDQGTTLAVSTPIASTKPIIVQYATDLAGPWTNLEIVPNNDGTILTYYFDKQPDAAFFRIVVQP